MAHPEAASVSRGVLPASLRLGPVHLIVSDLERSVEWYRRALGLHVQRHDDSEAELGDGVETIVVLHGDRDARPAGRHAGLYHYALLFPNREELARAVVRIAAAEAPVQGLSDHATHEAVYLPDPDGNGIELAADRPRERWPADQYGGGPAPLDVDSLLTTVAGEPRVPTVAEGLRVGHVHLHVGDIDEALAFYRDILGFELQAHLGTAAFVSAGGYHHHVGLNVWKGRGVGPPPPHTAGLRSWTVELGSDSEITEVRDRVETARLPVEPASPGFRVRDPWQTAVEFDSTARNAVA
jgi:catechol 2,3-dioxygenase